MAPGPGQQPPAMGPGMNAGNAPKAPIPGQGPAIGVLVAAAAILFAVFSKSWVTWAEGGGEGGGLGPLGGEFCGRRGVCQEISWAMLESPRVKLAGDISLLGTLALIAGLASAAAAIWMGVSVLTRKPFKLQEKLVRIVFGVASFGMSFFLMRLLTVEVKIKLGISYGGIIGIGGLVAAWVLYQKHLMPFLNALTPAGPAGAMPPGFAPPPYYPPQGAPPPAGFAPPPGAPPGAFAPQGQPTGPSPFVPPGAPPPGAFAPQGGPPPGAFAPQGQPTGPSPFAPPGAAPLAPQAAAPSGPGAYAPPSQSQRPCPRCQRLLTFVPQYQREFCDSCQQYM